MNKKKMLSLFLACCMLVGMIPAALAAEENPVPQEGTPTVTETTPAESAPVESTPVEVTTPVEKPAPVTEAPPAASPAIDEKDVVAKIGDVGYATLNAAVKEAKDGDTITLQKESTLTGGVLIEAKITLDMQGQTLETDGFSFVVAADLTINGNGTITNQKPGPTSDDSAIKTMFFVRDTGSLTIKNGTYDTKSAQIVLTKGKTVVESGTFTCSNDQAQKLYSGKCIMVASGEGAELTILSGTLTATEGTDYDGMNGVYAKNGANIILGDAASKTGPTIHCNYAAIGANNTTATSNITIYGGHYIIDTSGNSQSNVANKFNTVVYLPCDGTYEISGGTFETKGQNSHVFSVPYNNTAVNVTVSGGDFSASGNLFYFGTETAGNGAEGRNHLVVSGGTFDEDPSNYLADGYVALKDGSSYTVGKWDKLCAAALSATAAPGVTVKGMNLSGNVDTRTYAITDKVVQEDFATLLEKAPVQTRAAVETMVVKDGKNLAFANIQFTANGKALDTSAYYYVQQVNPGLGYAYSETDFPNNTKEKVYTGEQLKDGLNFILSDQTGDIVFRIAPCEQNASKLPEGAATYTIKNGVTFNASEVPGEAIVEVGGKADVDDTGKTTVKAEIPTDAVTGDTVTAAKENNENKVSIVVTQVSDNADKVEMTLPKEAVSALAAEEAKDVTTEIKTPVGDVSLPAEAVQQINGGANDAGVTLVVEKATVPTGTEASFVVSVKDTNGNSIPVADLPEEKPIVLSFNIGTGHADKHPQLFYKDENGLLVTIPSSYDPATGILSGETTHLSEFVQVNTPSGDGGLGKILTITPIKSSGQSWITVQVTQNGANAIYTIQQSGAVTISAPNGSTVTVWETESRPNFDTDTGAIKDAGTIYVTKTVKP